MCSGPICSMKPWDVPVAESGYPSNRRWKALIPLARVVVDLIEKLPAKAFTAVLDGKRRMTVLNTALRGIYPS